MHVFPPGFGSKSLENASVGVTLAGMVMLQGCRCMGKPTSIEEAKVRLTIAAMIATAPSRQGLRKCTASNEAVTTGPLATVLAARPAQMSIQLSTCMHPVIRTCSDLFIVH